MSSCGTCGKQLASKWKYCIYCGAALSRTAIDQLADLTGGIAAEPHPTAASRVAAGAVVFLASVTVIVVGIIYVLESQH